MADTAQDVIKDALRELGVLGKAQNLDDDDAQRGLTALNDLIDSWSLKPYAIYSLVERTHTLVASTASYTIGATGTIAVARPTQIKTAFIRDSNSIDHPVEVRSYLEYQDIVDKAVTSDLPDYIYYNPTHPNGTLFLFPTPSTGNTLHLTVEALLSTLSALSTTFTMPTGYRRALRKNLALELAPMFGAEVPRMLLRQANESLAEVKRTNNRNMDRAARLDPILLAMSSGRRGGGYNINTDS